jgi:hypothetical protein
VNGWFFPKCGNHRELDPSAYGIYMGIYMQKSMGFGWDLANNNGDLMALYIYTHTYVFIYNGDPPSGNRALTPSTII